MNRQQTKAVLANLVWQSAPTGSWSWWTRKLEKPEETSFQELIKEDDIEAWGHSHAIETWAYSRKLFVDRDIQTSDPLWGTQPKDENELAEAKLWIREMRTAFDLPTFTKPEFETLFNETTKVLYEAWIIALRFKATIRDAGLTGLSDVDDEILAQLFTR